jgi:hypothetical protein
MGETTWRGGLLGGLTLTVITVMWGLIIGVPREGECIGAPGSACWALHPVAVFLGGFLVGVPTGIVGGLAVGWLAGRIRRHRRLALLVIALASASLLEAIARHFMHSTADPDPLALWSTALVALVLGVLVLDRECARVYSAPAGTEASGGTLR